MEPKTLQDLQKSIPKDCFKISPFMSWFTFARIMILLGVFIWIESQISISSENIFWSLPLLGVICFMHGQILVGLFVLGHDCGHRSFSKNRLANLIMGHICFSPLGNGLASWTLTHNHHHAHTQLKGQDVDWSSYLMTENEFKLSTWKNNFARKLGYLLPFGLFFWVWLNAMKRGLQNNNPAVKLSNLIMWSVMLSIYASLWFFLGPVNMIKYHGLPAFIAMVSGYFLLTIQHANESSRWFNVKSWSPIKGQVGATFDVRFPRIFEWLWLDINIHTPHHVSPGMPWYKLREASIAIKALAPELYQEREFGLRELSWMMKTPQIEFMPEENAYKLSK